MQPTDPALDIVDTYLAQWKALLPTLPTAGMAVSGRIARIATLYRQRIAPVLHRHELEEWEYDVLATLRRSGNPEGTSMSELAAHMLLAPGSATHRIEQLVRRKWVTRRADPDSRRRVLVSLTAAGRARVDAVLPELAEVLAAPVRRLDRARRAEVMRGVKTLLHSLEAAAAADALAAASPPPSDSPRKRTSTRK